MKSIVSSVIATLVLSASTVHGQSAVEGLGLRPCTDVAASKAENPELYRAFATWLEGFISAANGRAGSIRGRNLRRRFRAGDCDVPTGKRPYRDRAS